MTEETKNLEPKSTGMTVKEFKANIKPKLKALTKNQLIDIIILLSLKSDKNEKGAKKDE